MKTDCINGQTVIMFESNNEAETFLKKRGITDYKFVSGKEADKLTKKTNRERLRNLSLNTLLDYIECRADGEYTGHYLYDKEEEPYTNVAYSDNSDFQFLNSLHTNEVLKEVKRRMGPRAHTVQGKDVW